MRHLVQGENFVEGETEAAEPESLAGRVEEKVLSGRMTQPEALLLG